MPSFVLTDAYVSINSVNLSDRVRSVRINYQADIVDNTAMGATAHTRLPALRNWSAEVEFNQDYAASNVDATLFPLVGAAAFAVEFRPTSSAASPTNPKFTGNCLLESYAPMAGSVGELATTTVSLTGTGALNRGTS